MKFGLLYEVQREMSGDDVDENKLYQETLEQCGFADKMGFDYLWFVEHHFLTGFSASPCPEVLLGALSQLTKRIRLGFGVSILPYHHPVRVAERVAMVDQLTGGRVEFGTGRSSAYEQTGMGIDPRDTREMWEESLAIISNIWKTPGEFSWEGKFWNVPPRRVLPRPYQTPHPPMWVAGLQPSTYELAAEKGLGVLFSAAFAISILDEHVKAYRQKILAATPVGEVINNQWATNVHAHCGDDDQGAKDLCAESLKNFFGPDKPYISGRVGIYEELLKAWGGVPDHLKTDFARWLRAAGSESKDAASDAGVSLETGPGAAQAALSLLDSQTLCDRGVIVAGDPESCIKIIRQYEEIGVDQLIMIMQTETIPHEKVMNSLRMFGEYVIPRFRED